MFTWLKRLFGRVKRVELPGGLAIDLREQKEHDTASPALVPFTGFTPWRRTKNVISGASTTRVRLKRHRTTSETDWALLCQLWFYVIEKGSNTHTFGYKQAELPTHFHAALSRWIHQATHEAGQGDEMRETPEGTVVRVNIDARTITVDDTAS